MVCHKYQSQRRVKVSSPREISLAEDDYARRGCGGVVSGGQCTVQSIGTWTGIGDVMSVLTGDGVISAHREIDQMSKYIKGHGIWVSHCQRKD